MTDGIFTVQYYPALSSPRAWRPLEIHVALPVVSKGYCMYHGKNLWMKSFRASSCQQVGLCLKYLQPFLLIFPPFAHKLTHIFAAPQSLVLSQHFICQHPLSRIVRLLINTRCREIKLSIP